jgi:DHA1 family tetracycline resistance protein-like MFS transporter
LGVTLSCIGLICFGLSNVSWMMFAAIIPYCTGNMSGPVLQGFVSSQVPANQQGALQGATTSLMSLASIIGPPLMTNLYAYFTEPGAPFQLPGAPFFLGAILAALAFGVLVAHIPKLKHATNKN